MKPKGTFKADFVIGKVTKMDVTIMERGKPVRHSSEEARKCFEETAGMCEEVVRGYGKVVKAEHRKRARR